jgi:8-oxo-dGTP pyrophosphatase MutT (NUDIX family)
MALIYKVFVKETPIIVTSDPSGFEDYKCFKLKKVNLAKIVKKVLRGELKKVCLYSKNEEKLTKRLHKKLKLVIAAGGLVVNSQNDYLFIHRNGRWDLPKGKAEKGESIEETALREVQEETGVQGLSITEYIGRTYHVYRHNGKFKLKLTHWYLMSTASDVALVPEEREGIMEAKWLDPGLTKLALKDSYANIRQLFPETA